MKDVSLDSLASAFSSLATSISNGQNGIAHALGEAIRDRAKEKIGDYQPSSHGFDAWLRWHNQLWTSACQRISGQ